MKESKKWKIMTLILLVIMISSVSTSAFFVAAGSEDAEENESTENEQRDTCGKEYGEGSVQGGTRGGRGETIYVDSENGDDDTGEGTVLKPYATIGKGIEAATDGDTISVNPGTYTENVVVGKMLTIRSTFMSPGNTSVEAADSGTDVFHITADQVNLSGFSISGTTYHNSAAAVEISSANNCTISGIVVTDSYYCIYLVSSHGCTIADNDLTDNDRAGVILSESDENIIRDNTIDSCIEYGILLDDYCDNNILERNSIDNCKRGIMLDYYSTENRVVNNTADSSQYNGIDINFNSNNNIISGNILSHNSIGIYASQYCEGNWIDNNTVRNNIRGIFSAHNEDFTLRHNNMTDNSYNLGINGMDETDYRHDIDPSNTVDGKQVHYWIDRQDSVAPADAGYFAAIACDNITIRDLQVSHNCDGILLAYTHNSRIINVTASDCMFGIRLEKSDNNEISRCRVSDSTQDNGLGGRGIYLENSVDSVISDNTVSGVELKAIELSGHSTGNRISGNTVEDNPGWGISVNDNADRAIVENNRAMNNNYGIMLSRTDDTVLRNNTVEDNDRDGIRVFSSVNTILDNNTATGNGETGIMLSRSSYANLSNNTMEDNDVDFDIYGLYEHEYIHEIDETNTVGSGAIYYWSDRHDEVITGDDIAYIIVANSTNITIRDLSFEGMETGLLLVNTHDSLIENVTVTNCGTGISLMSCNNNTLRDIVANENEDYGVSLESSKENALSDVTTNDNGAFGIYVRTDSDFTIIDSCTANDNYYQGIYLSYSHHNTVTDCYASGNEQSGILLIQAVDNLVLGNTVTGNIKSGITLSNHCTDNLVENNSAVNNVGDGITITDDCEDNTLTSNSVVGNEAAGILVDQRSEENIIVNNTVTENTGYGIRIGYNAVDNLIYDNFFRNDHNAIDESGGSNRWNTTKTAGENIIGGEFLAGNYWNDYDGLDTDGDGIGDTKLPYNSTSGIENGGDALPLYYPIPVFEVNKTVDRNNVLPGDNVTFTIIIRNVGTNNATNVSIVETYGEFMRFLSADPAPDPSGDNDTWSIERLAINESFSFNITVQMSKELHDGDYPFNRVDVTCDEGISAFAEERVYIVSPLLLILKYDDPDEVENGDIITYTIDITNFGSMAATNVTVIETYDDNITFVEADPEPTEGTNYWNLGTIADHSATQIELMVRVKDDVANGTVIFNNVSVSCDEGFSTYAHSYTSVIYDEPPRNVTMSIDGVWGDIEPEGILTIAGGIISDPAGTVESVKLFLNGSYRSDAQFTDNDYNGTLQLPAVFPEGNHTITVEVQLQSGETATTNATIVHTIEPVIIINTITVDPIEQTIAPGLSLTITGNITLDPSDMVPVDIEGAVRDVRVVLDGIHVGNATPNGAGYSLTFVLPADLAEGNHIIVVNVTLHSNASGETSITIACEKEEPVVHTISITVEDPIGTIEPGSGITLDGIVTIEPLASIKTIGLSLDGAPLQMEETITDREDGFRLSLTFTLPSDLSEGAHTLTVNITLETGESGERSRDFIYSITSEEEDEEEDEGMGIGVIVILVVIMIVILLVLLMKMGLIPLGDTGKTESWGKYTQVKSADGPDATSPPGEKEPLAGTEPQKSDEGKGTGKGTENGTDHDGDN